MKTPWMVCVSALALSAGACGGGGGTGAGPTVDGGNVESGISVDGGGGSDSSTPPSDAGGGTGDAGDSGMGTAPIRGLRLFYSDLTSGPNTGGENGKGAYVTLVGNGFGIARGSSTVTVGGGAADNYPVWTNTKITFQLGAAAKTGNVVVNVSGKGASNGLPFTVRAGNIFFVSSSGADTNPGSFASPWATIPQAKNTIQ